MTTNLITGCALIEREFEDSVREKWSRRSQNFLSKWFQSAFQPPDRSKLECSRMLLHYILQICQDSSFLTSLNQPVQFSPSLGFSWCWWWGCLAIFAKRYTHKRVIHTSKCIYENPPLGRCYRWRHSGLDGQCMRSLWIRVCVCVFVANVVGQFFCR